MGCQSAEEVGGWSGRGAVERVVGVDRWLGRAGRVPEPPLSASNVLLLLLPISTPTLFLPSHSPFPCFSLIFYSLILFHVSVFYLYPISLPALLTYKLFLQEPHYAFPPACFLLRLVAVVVWHLQVTTEGAFPTLSSYKLLFLMHYSQVASSLHSPGHKHLPPGCHVLHIPF